MKKILLNLLFIIILSLTVHAANVGVVVLIPNGHIYSDCINIDDGQSAYDAFEKTPLDMEWADFGFGYFLESVEGYASDNNAGKYWSFWHINSQGDDFEAGMVGADDYEISSDDKVVGLSLTAYDSAYNPISNPPFYSYESLCENEMKISNVKFNVDSKTKSADIKDTIDATPGSKVKITVKIENLNDDESLRNVRVEGVIKDVDGDLDDSDETNIKPGENEDLTLNFKIPTDADEDKYDVILTITADGILNYKKVLNYKLDVNKEDDKIKLLLPDYASANCGDNWNLKMELSNLGSNDEDIVFQVSNPSYGLLAQDSMSINEGDEETKIINVKIPEDASGIFDLNINLKYESESDDYTTTLNVNCDNQASQHQAQQQTQIIQQSQQQVVSQQQIIAPPKTNKDFKNAEVLINNSTKNNTTNILVMVFVNLLLVGFIIFLVLK